MLVKHAGRLPEVHPTAWIAPNAVVSGLVRIGPETRVLYGAVLTAESGAEMKIGAGCVIMEQSVLRAAGRFSLSLGDRVLVGPHAYLTGCSADDYCFLATGSMIFNGASLGRSCVIALGGKVHIDTQLPDDTRVPMGYIAFGRPAVIHPPEEAPDVHRNIDRIGFMRYVFGIDIEGKDRAQIMEEAISKYCRALKVHQNDEILA